MQSIKTTMPFSLTMMKKMMMLVIN